MSASGPGNAICRHCKCCASSSCLSKRVGGQGSVAECWRQPQLEVVSSPHLVDFEHGQCLEWRVDAVLAGSRQQEALAALYCLTWQQLDVALQRRFVQALFKLAAKKRKLGLPFNGDDAATTADVQQQLEWFPDSIAWRSPAEWFPDSVAWRSPTEWSEAEVLAFLEAVMRHHSAEKLKIWRRAALADMAPVPSGMELGQLNVALDKLHNECMQSKQQAQPAEASVPHEAPAVRAAARAHAL